MLDCKRSELYFIKNELAKKTLFELGTKQHKEALHQLLHIVLRLDDIFCKALAQAVTNEWSSPPFDSRIRFSEKRRIAIKQHFGPSPQNDFMDKMGQLVILELAC